MTRKEKVLKGNVDKLGYIHFRLTKDGKATLYKAHVLMAENFLGYDRSKYDRRNIMSLVVHHIDRNKKNNKLSNLTIITQLENIHLYFKDKKERGRR